MALRKKLTTFANQDYTKLSERIKKKPNRLKGCRHQYHHLQSITMNPEEVLNKAEELQQEAVEKVEAAEQKVAETVEEVKEEVAETVEEALKRRLKQWSTT